MYPIRKVRLAIPSKSIRPIRNGEAFVELGNTHHVCIFEIDTPSGNKTKESVFVSMLEAMQRVRRREAIVQRTHPENPTARFLFSLSGSELVELEHNGTRNIYRFEKGASTSGQMWFRHHAAGGKSAEKIGQVSKRPSTLVARKVTVDPLGQIRWAND